MKYIKEFRNPAFVKGMLNKIKNLTDKNVVIMEVCGTHTMSIFKSGIRALLPENIKLISGPGCPVCVTSQGYIDTAIALSDRPDVIVTTFGDMLKVPGNNGSLRDKKALGKDIRIVFSPLDGLKIARENPDKQVVFLGVGFETTAPTIALAVKKASEEGLENFSVLQSIKTMPATMEVLVMDDSLQIDGFICPGHVSAVIGAQPYDFLAEKYNVPAVVAGFEAGDIVKGLYDLIEMIVEEKPQVLNTYKRLVSYEGNTNAIKLIDEVMESCDSVWRGLGNIPETGLKLRSAYSAYDAETKLGLELLPDQPLEGCICGDILKGKQQPLDCPMFGTACNPENPVGACMVSEEGTCAAYYKYEHISE